MVAQIRGGRTGSKGHHQASLFLPLPLQYCVLLELIRCNLLCCILAVVNCQYTHISNILNDAWPAEQSNYIVSVSEQIVVFAVSRVPAVENHKTGGRVRFKGAYRV